MTQSDIFMGKWFSEFSELGFEVESVIGNVFLVGVFFIFFFGGGLGVHIINAGGIQIHIVFSCRGLNLCKSLTHFLPPNLKLHNLAKTKHIIQKTISNFLLFVLPFVEKAAFMFNENFSAAKNAASYIRLLISRSNIGYFVFEGW